MSVHFDEVLDLRGMQPSPQRLLEIVAATVGPGAGYLLVDWGGRFPWRVDADLPIAEPYPESLVGEAGKIVSRAGWRMSMVVRDPLPAGYDTRRGYRHLVRASGGHDDRWIPALGKLVSDLADDARELLPVLDSLALASSAAATRSVAAYEAVGLRLVELPKELESDDESQRLGGVEERLERAGGTARLERGFSAVHDEVRRYREEGWRLVARLHEALLRAEARPGWRGRALAESRPALARHIGAARRLRRNLESVYDGIAAEGAVRRYLGAVTLPLREQYTGLSGRVNSVRMLR